MKKAPYKKRRKRKGGPLKWHIIAAESTNRKFSEKTATPKMRLLMQLSVKKCQKPSPKKKAFFSK
jgi:hypothetical protein